MFYDKYVRLCNSVNKTPSAVALEIGIAKPTVSRWKAGSIPNYATAQKVADYFNVPVNLLINQEKPAAESSEPTDEAYQQIKEFVMNANEAEKADVMKYIDFIKSKRE